MQPSFTSVFTFAFVAIVLLVVAAKSIVFTKSDERAVVFRFDKFMAVYPAGMVIVIPFLDKVVKVRVEQIAGWERLSEDQLLERISEIYRSD